LIHSQQPGAENEPQVPQEEQTSSIPTSLRIYNLRGQLVKTMIDDELSPGRYELTWDGTDENGEKVASGVYLYRLKTPQIQTTRRMILLK
jgi:flagellar hook assembly protein FlgD